LSYKYILNPKYEYFKDNLLDIRNIFNSSNDSIHKARNELKIINIDGKKYVVKSFKVPHFINRLAYTYFREGKAKKSYLNAVKLEKLDINTPTPIGVIEFFENSLVSQSYFISLYEPYDFTIREVFRHQVDDIENILKEFAKFTYALHSKGVWHVDYSSGNILITKVNEKYKFSLVDINRMEFKNISPKEGLTNFNKFWADKDDLDIIIKEYAKLANIDFNQAQKITYASVAKVEQKKQFKNALKQIKKLPNKYLPSRKINTDIAIEYNKIQTIKPIQLHDLSLIPSIKKEILKKRSNTKNLTIQREQKKMSLIVPFRLREEHLKVFLPYIQNYLKEQSINFEIIIVNQNDKQPFNRAKLMNVGVLHAADDSDYYVFHDVDLLPENIDYRFCNHSLKLFTYIKQEDKQYKKYKESNFGGAVLVPKNIFFDINGFSNNYWQWGSEDDDFLMRHLFKGYVPLYDAEGKFETLPHPHSLTRDVNGEYTSSNEIQKKNKLLREKNKKTFSKFKRGLSSQEDDGIKTIDNYNILSLKEEKNIKYVDVSFD
jgi:hypothetical protein